MTTRSRSIAVEPNVLSSMWGHRFLIAAIAAVFAALGVALTTLNSGKYASEAGVLLEDPRTSVLTEAPPARDEVRYVANQIAIMKSNAVLTRASQLTARGGSPGLSPRELQRAMSISTTEESNFVVVRVETDDPALAKVAADAIVQAYRNVVRADRDAEIAAALQKLNVAITNVARTLANPDTTEAQAANALPLLQALRSQRSRLQVDAQLVGDGVALFSPADPGKRQGPSFRASLIVALIIGGLIGTAIAYGIDAVRARRIGREAPFDAPPLAEIPDFRREGLDTKLPVLDVPESRSAEAFRLLAAIVGLPRASSNGSTAAGFAESLQAEFPGMSRRELAVLDLVASRLDELVLETKKPSEQDSGESAVKHRSVAFVSAAPGEGTTTVTANSAIAAAQAGDRVLVLDGDLRGHGLTRLLLGDRPTFVGTDGKIVGFTDMLSRGTLLGNTKRILESEGGGSLSLVEPGSATLDAMNAIRTERIVAGLNSTRDEFERVFIDVPPVLQFPWADALLKSVDAVVVVGAHRGETAQLEQVLDRLELLGVRPLGHVYTLVPPWESKGRALLSTLFGRSRKQPARSVPTSPALSPVPSPAYTDFTGIDEQKTSPASEPSERASRRGGRWA